MSWIWRVRNKAAVARASGRSLGPQAPYIFFCTIRTFDAFLAPPSSTYVTATVSPSLTNSPRVGLPPASSSLRPAVPNPLPETIVLPSTEKVAVPVFSLIVNEFPDTADTTPVAVIDFGFGAASALAGGGGGGAFGTDAITRTVSACISAS